MSFLACDVKVQKRYNRQESICVCRTQDILLRLNSIARPNGHPVSAQRFHRGQRRGSNGGHSRRSIRRLHSRQRPRTRKGSHPGRASTTPRFKCGPPSALEIYLSIAVKRAKLLASKTRNSSIQKPPTRLYSTGIARIKSSLSGTLSFISRGREGSTENGVLNFHMLAV
jgi:hypothetical protein